jgi:hypothetical protein
VHNGADALQRELLGSRHEGVVSIEPRFLRTQL